MANENQGSKKAMALKPTNNAIILGSNGGLRDMLRTNLKGMGFTVLESTPSAKLALERLGDARTTCDVIISEVTLEGMSCRSFLAELRTMPDFDETMIYLLASDMETEELESCLEFGIAGILKKPFNNDAFPELLKAPYNRLKFLNGSHKALFLCTFSNFCESQCRFKAAIRYLEESILLADAAISRFELGRLFLRVSNLPQAEFQLAKAIELNQSFKTPAEKAIAQFRAENASDEAAFTSAIDAFLLPLGRFGNSYRNQQRLRKGLVVGGSHGDRVAVKTFLTNLGMKQVTMLESPEQAVKVLKDCDVNLVVTWLKFEKSDSLALTRLLREIYTNREMKILVVVDEKETRELAQVLEAGADGYFVPPFIAENFCQRLHRCMVLQDLTGRSQAQPLAKAAYTMFETKQYDLGQTFAERALRKDPDDHISKLFLAMNLHLQLQKEWAFACYDELIAQAPAMAQAVVKIKAELDLLAAELELQQTVTSHSKAPKKPTPALKVPETSKPVEPEKEEVPEADDDFLGDDFADEGGSEEAAPTRRRRRASTGEDLAVVSKIEDDEVKLGAGALKKAPPPAPPPPEPIPAPAEEEPAPAPALPTEPPTPTAKPVAPARPAHVIRKRYRVRKESMGSFPNLEALQQEVFGRIEPITPEVPIPRDLFDQGVSEVDLVQPLGIEPVFGHPPARAPASFGDIKFVEQSVVPWLPTETLEPMQFGKETPASDADGEASSKKSAVIQITEQAQLLNSRIICLPDKQTGTRSFFEYVSTLGKVVAEKDLVSTFQLEKHLDPGTRKLLEEVRNDSSDEKRNSMLGNAVIARNIADGIFKGMASRIDDSEIRSIAESSLDELKAPLVEFHRECLNGKKEFENKLPYVLKTIAKGKVDFEMLYKAMDQDHNSLEAFKKIYRALARANKRDELDRFFKERHGTYLENEESAKALKRFLLLAGDVKRLKEVEPKANVDEMKRMALEWYHRNDLDMSLTLCKRLISRNAHLEFAFNLMGVTYRKMGRLKEAIDAYAKGIEVKPDSIKLHHNMSIALSIVGNIEEARLEAEKAKVLKETFGESQEG